jgi:hypothetical protein
MIKSSKLPDQVCNIRMKKEIAGELERIQIKTEELTGLRLNRTVIIEMLILKGIQKLEHEWITSNSKEEKL